MSIVKNSLYNILYQVLTVIMPIITMPYISRVLGETGVGKQAYTGAIVQYFILLGALGLDLYGNRQIAYVRDDSQELRNVFWELCYLRIITSGVSLLLYLLFFVIINKGERLIYIIQSLNIIASGFDISWYYMGIEKFKNIALRNTLIKLIGLFLIFIFVKDINDINKYIFIIAFIQLMGQIPMWKKIPKIIYFNKISKVNLKKHLIPAIKLFIPQLAAQVYLLLDKIMLGLMVGDASVGLYDNSQKVIRLVLPIVTSIGSVMIPRMSNLYANGETTEFKRNIYTVFSFMNFIAIPMTFGLMGIAKGLKPWFFGNNFDGITILLCVSSFVIVFGTWCNVIGFQVLISMGKEKEFTKSVFIGAITNFLLNMILITKFKEVGTTIASVIAELLVPLVQIYYVRNFINIKKLFRGTYRYILASISMLIIINSLNYVFNPTIFMTITQITLGIGWYLTIMYILKDKNMLLVKGILKKILNTRILKSIGVR